ncbi:MAG: cytochrome c3 family protein [Phycisphaerae bacterium]|nr:cytochrome c3 family protein [Phycisphaerae bacterium]
MKISLFCLLWIILICLLWCSSALATIEGSPHDLSVIGGRNPCSYCHTPHGALVGTPLWNHKLSSAVYKIYESTSLDAKVGQPTGSSKLCLSCHDGTIALTETIGGEFTGGTYISPDVANIGTDLSDDHPISFIYSAALSAEDTEIRPPSILPSQLKLDRSNELQCTTCHDPHDNQYGNFMVMPNDRSAMCVSCHDLYGWINSSHERSSVPLVATSDTYLQATGFATVGDAGCLSCHRPHLAGGHQRLLHFSKSEDNCLNCHDGSVATTNLRTEINKFSRHDVTRYNGIHDPTEIPTSAPEHVECVDCHNPHSMQSITVQAPVAKGAIRGVSGVTASGGTTPRVQYEYEVCYKCHGDNPNRVQSSITRQITQTNTRLEFDISNPSFHPVVSTGVNKNVPSLLQPMTVADIIYCTDCHSSNSGSGAKGPHGSIYPNLLAKQYQTADFTKESDYAYALCYSCHSRNSILNDESFPKHEEHLKEDIPCSACHDPHGISSAQGNLANNTHLINFDISIVSPDQVTGFLEFDDLGQEHGRCFLACHGKEHSPEEY